MFAGASHNQKVSRLDFLVVGRVHHVAAASPDGHHGYSVLIVGAAESGFLQRMAQHCLGRMYFCEAEVGNDGHVIDDAGVEADVGRSPGAFHLGMDDLIRADSLKYISMPLVGSPGDDERQAKAFEQRCDQDAGLNIVVAQGHHRHVEVGYVQFFKDRFGGGIGPDRIGHVTQHVLNLSFVNVYGQNVVAGLVQLLGHGGSEPAQADYAYLLFHRYPPSAYFNPFPGKRI